MNQQSKFLNYYNFINNKNKVIGISIIRNGFSDKLHYHAVPEYYYLFYGTANLHISENITTVSAPHKHYIPENVPHKLIAKSNFVILFYYFVSGPFEKIKYNFLQE